MPFPQNRQIPFYSTAANIIVISIKRPNHIIDNVPLSLVHHYRGETSYNYAIWFFVKMKIIENIASRSFGNELILNNLAKKKVAQCHF